MAKRKAQPPWDDKRWGRRAERIKGTDLRDKPPGLYATDANIKTVQQPTSFVVESGAMHSKSRGWLPVVYLEMELIDPTNGQPSGSFRIVLEQDSCMTLLHDLEECLDRSREDARVAFEDIRHATKREE